MKPLRSFLTCALLGLASLGVVAVTPARSDAYFYNYFGAYRYPYYWRNYSGYNPYSRFSNYGYGRYGYGVSPYYRPYGYGYSPLGRYY